MRALAVVGLALLLMPAAAAELDCLADDPYHPEQVHVTIDVDVMGETTGLVVQWTQKCPTVLIPSRVEWTRNGVGQMNLDGLLAGMPIIQDQAVITGTALQASSPVFLARLGPLDPGDEVEYRIANGESATGWFETTMPGGDLRVVAYGDQGTRGVADDGSRMPGQASAPMDVRDAAAGHDPDLLLLLGDLAYADDAPPYGAGWDRYLRMMEPLLGNTPAMTVAGNHEAEAATAAFRYDQYLQRFVLPEDEHHYGFQVGPVFFVAMNSDLLCTDTPGAPEGECENLGEAVDPDVTVRLEQELATAQASGAPWIVVMLHHNVYSVADHYRYEAIKNRWTPHFEAAGVDLVLSGHSHSYQRTFPLVASAPQSTDPDAYDEGDGVVYVVAGGGGRALRDINATRVAAAPWLAEAASQHGVVVIDADATALRLTAYNETGTVLDGFTITASSGSGTAAAVAPGLLAVAFLRRNHLGKRL